MSCKPARLTAHPYANFLPLLEGEPFDKLVAGVKAIFLFASSASATRRRSGR